MSRNRIIAITLAGVVSVTALGSALAFDHRDDPSEVLTSGGSSAAPAVVTSTSTTASERHGVDAPIVADATTTTSTTTATEAAGTGASEQSAAAPADPAPPAGGAPTAPSGDASDTPAAPVHDVLPGAGTPPPTNPTDPSDPIGELDDDRPVPGAFDFTAPPKKPGAHLPGGATDLAVEPSCSHQCITKGVAYPRGFGVELVVETEVRAQLFITVVADLDGNGDYEDLHVESTPFAVTTHAWAIDHLEPGQKYYVMAAATDEHQHTAHVWGEFTTLSKRDVFVSFGQGEITGGPSNTTSTNWLLGLDGPLTDVTPGQQGILLYKDQPRQIDLDFWVVRNWDDDLCEVVTMSDDVAHGHSVDGCTAWNSTSVDAVDLDRAPAGSTRWTQTSVALSLHPPTGAGNPLPPGYGDPYYFSFDVPVTLYVSYS